MSYGCESDSDSSTSSGSETSSSDEERPISRKKRSIDPEEERVDKSAKKKHRKAIKSKASNTSKATPSSSPSEHNDRFANYIVSAIGRLSPAAQTRARKDIQMTIWCEQQKDDEQLRMS